MYAAALSKYEINMIITLCDSILRDPTIRFSKNSAKVELRNCLTSVKVKMNDALMYGDMEGESDEQENRK